MKEDWQGIFKLIEEMGEVQQLLGKIGAYPDGHHPDRKGPLKERLQDELGDLLAAFEYFIEINDLDAIAITSHEEYKRELFKKWGGLQGVYYE